MNSAVPASIPADNRPGRLPARVAIETLLVGALLLMMFIIRVQLALSLEALGAFRYYDTLFDADANIYLSALAEGWGAHRIVHPGFALWLNLPLRALASFLSMAGCGPAPALRHLLALCVAPAASAAGGLLWWHAARCAGFRRAARLGGTALCQLAFSQSVFGAIPESYGISGALICALLLLTSLAARDPTSMDQPRTRTLWLGLACVMAGITITNGALCVAAWAALRLDRIRLRRMLAEVGVAGVVILAAALAQGALVKSLYKETRHDGTAVAAWTQRFLNDQPLRQATLIPYAYVASVLPLQTVELAPDQRNPNRKMSLTPVEGRGIKVTLGWAALAVLCLQLWRSRTQASLLRPAAAVLLFNGLLHTVFGTELFLYSQHWLGFLVFAALLPARAATGWRAGLGVAAIAGIALVLDWHAWEAIFRMLGATA